MIRSRTRGLRLPHRTAGFGLWDVVLLVALIAAMLVAALVSQQARTHLRAAEEQSATVLWADQQVAGFAASHLRLPCPDINKDGLEDCAAGAANGLLPLLTMGLQADAATRGPVRITYKVQRPSAMDPVILGSYFEPQKWDGERYAYGTSNGLDLCGKLADIVADDPAAVAYSVAVTRQDGTPDLVRERSAAELVDALSCITTMASVNGIALAVDVVTEVLEQQAQTHDAAIITIAFNVLHIALAAIDITLAAIGLAASIAIEAAAASALATAIALCVIGVGCPFIPPYTAAVAAAAVAIALFGTTIGLNAAAIIVLAASTGLAIDVAIKTGNDPGDQTLDVDLGQQEQAAIDAENTATTAENDAANSAVRVQAALIARDMARKAVTDVQTGSEIDAALAAAVALDNAQMANDEAQGQYDLAVEREGKLQVALTQAQASCAGAKLPDEQYKCDAVTAVNSRLQDAQAAVPVAQATLTAAQAAAAIAQTNYDQARAAVQTKFPGLWAFPAPGLGQSIDDYRKAYLAWQRETSAYNGLHQTALDLRSAATQARDSYNQLKYNYEHPGSTPTGSAITVWAGAEAILKQADANGVVE